MDSEINPNIHQEFPTLNLPAKTGFVTESTNKNLPHKTKKLIVISVCILVAIFGVVGYIYKSRTPIEKSYLSEKQTSPGEQKLSEKQIRDRIDELEKMTNEKNYEGIYELFFSPNQKSMFYSYFNGYKGLFLQSITKYYEKNNMFIKFDIENVTVKGDEAYVKRRLKTCNDINCSQLLSNEESVVEWYRKNGYWYTNQEEPLCIREAPYNTSSSSEGVSKKTEPKTEVQIIWKIECGMFPIYFNDYPINTKVTEVSPIEMKRTVDILEKALNKYPVDTIKRSLYKIYLLGSINNFGAEYGGTNAWKYVYLTNQGLNKGYTDRYVEQVFHQEFSSILLAENDPYYQRSNTIWNNPTWNSFNDPDFLYGTGGYNEILENRASQELDQKFIAKGFLDQYSTSSAENDFNEIAMNLFSSSDNFWKTVDANERIKRKVEFVIDFYHRIDPLFTEDYFRSLSEL